MKRTSNLSITIAILILIAFFAWHCGEGGHGPVVSDSTQLNPDSTLPAQSGAFQNHRDSVPSQQQYSNPLFVLSHDYPTTVTPLVNPPWRQALQGKPISHDNFKAYMDSLKAYVAPNLLPFFTDNANWTAAGHGWFHEPWVGSQREAILGTYLGNGNGAGMFKTLKVDEAGYVLVLYDSISAYTVGQIWGKTGQKVNLLNNATQFAEGSIVIKLAFSNINYPEWSVMKNAQIFNVYDTISTNESPNTGYQMRPVSFFQMDVIVKDSATSPKTGWVYSTFVYDMNAKGSTWEKMVPLGAMWGNDPDVNSPAAPPYPKLNETVINEWAPEYSKETLGWGGRLSGPNDGAVATNVVDLSGKKYARLAISSCMSCHSPAQDTLNAGLVPMPKIQPGPDPIVFTPGSSDWDLWFRDNWGNVPFNAGSVAMDYDMVMAFKSVPAWQAAQPSGQSQTLKETIRAFNAFRKHNAHSQFWH